MFPSLLLLLLTRDAAAAPTAADALAQLSPACGCSSIRVTTVADTKPVLRSDPSRQAIEVSDAFVKLFPEEELLVAAIAHEIGHIELRTDLANADGEARVDQHAAFLLDRAGRDPAALVRLLDALPRRIKPTDADRKTLATRAQRLGDFLARDLPSARTDFTIARGFQSLGAYDQAVAKWEVLATKWPDNAEILTNLGLSLLGRHYATRVYAPTRDLILDLYARPPGASSPPPTLDRSQLRLVLARGFRMAMDLPDGTRKSAGGGALPADLERAHSMLRRAHDLLPSEPRSLVNLFLAQIEVASWDRALVPDLELTREAVEKAAGTWGPFDAGTAWLNLGLYHYLVGSPSASASARVESAIVAWKRAESMGEAGGALNNALVMLLDPDLKSRRDEGLEALARIKRERLDPDGLLSARLGTPSDRARTPPVTVTWSRDRKLQTLAELVGGKGSDLLGPEAKDLHLDKAAEAALPNGAITVIEPDGRGAWVFLPDTVTGAVREHESSDGPPPPPTWPAFPTAAPTPQTPGISIEVRSTYTCPGRDPLTPPAFDTGAPADVGRCYYVFEFVPKPSPGP